MTESEKEAGRIIAERVLSCVVDPSDLALLSPERAAGLLDVRARELPRFIALVRLSAKTLRYRVSDIKQLLGHGEIPSARGGGRG